MSPPITLALAATRAKRRVWIKPLPAVADLHDVAILDDVVFSFQAEQTLFLQSLMAAELLEVIVVADFRANEMLLQVRMDRTRSALRVRPSRNRPRATFFFSNGEE